MQTPPLKFAKAVRAPAYLILVLTALLPLIDLIIAVWPMNPGALPWRYGAVGLGAGAVGVPTLILLLIFVLALLTEDRRVVLTVAIISAVSAVLFLVFSVSLSLDALQMRRNVQPQAVQRFDLASALATLKLLLYTAAMIVLSLAAFRASRRQKASKVADKEMIIPGLSEAAGRAT
jgi:hypothetical protein